LLHFRPGHIAADGIGIDHIAAAGRNNHAAQQSNKAQGMADIPERCKHVVHKVVKQLASLNAWAQLKSELVGSLWLVCVSLHTHQSAMLLKRKARVQTRKGFNGMRDQ